MKAADSAGNAPTVLVIFGATGDLMERKIAPSLFHLYDKRKLPKNFRAIGFARRKISDKEFREHVKKSLLGHRDFDAKKGNVDSFLGLFSYSQGMFDRKQDYKKLASALKEIDDEWGLCTNKLFYLAVPPRHYGKIFANLSRSGLTKPCSDHEGWTRVLVEKPFGNDLKTAKKLDRLLGRLFKEEQVYRIDHYLAKEMLQNILAFRFSNNIFEQSMNSNFVERIDIKLHETLGAEDRGAFYDNVGALRDVGQNHLLQMLSLVTMNQPPSFDSRGIRAMRSQLMESLRIMPRKEVKKSSFRAQYEGYRKIKGVKPNSDTETYFRVKTMLESPRWGNVPVFIESGKKMGKAVKNITISFRHHSPCLCKKGEHYQNKIIFSLEPEEGIKIVFWSKKPGLKMETEKRAMDFLLRKKKGKEQYVEEYEKLLLDCISGDQTLFVGTREIEAMWRFIDPIAKAWGKNSPALESYKPGAIEVPGAERINGRTAAGSELKKEIGIIGLGKMGAGIARQLIDANWRVIGYNRTGSVTKKMEKNGLIGAYSLAGLVEKLPKPRVVWLMLPAGKAIDRVIFGRNGLTRLLGRGDIIIDGGNSFYRDSVKRHKKLAKKGIHFVDAGVSGGPKGARHGACIMVGGKKRVYEKLLPLFTELVVPNGVEFFNGPGAGHFVKMVHNGIEYGMMQAIAEGFGIMDKSGYSLDLEKAASVYSHGSVIESRLMSWLGRAFELRGKNLRGTSGSVGHTGEGKWTAKTAEKLGVKAKVIADAVKFRVMSEKKPSYTGKILSALREQFGGHAAK